MPDAELLGLSATFRLFHCKDDQWIFLALTNHRERERFVSVVEDAEIGSPSAELLAGGGEPAISALGKLFIDQDADYWEKLFTTAGVGCVRADRLSPGQFWLEDEQVRSMQITAEVEHPNWGTYRRHGAMVLFDNERHPLGPPPLAGQHNEELLLTHGYTAQQIASLTSEGVLWSEET